MTNEQRFKQCLEWILENIHKPFVNTSIIEHNIIHTLHVGNTIDTPIEKSDKRERREHVSRRSRKEPRMLVTAPEGANRVANEEPCIPYLHAGPIPIYIGFAPDEKAFLAEMERLGTKDVPPYTLSDATTHHFRSEGGMTCIVCIKPREGICKEQWIGLLVHEAAHVWQAIRESMDEENPSSEFEAYTLQYISQWLVGQAPFPEQETALKA